MDTLLKILAVVLSVAAIVALVIVLDRRIARLADIRLRLFARSLLYAVAFTPTAYHHAPNTIIAPLHLSTICGNLFYSYDYTFAMFVYGVGIPIVCGWMLITLALLFHQLPRLS